MKILYSQLIELPVHTQADDYLGKVFDIEINTDTYSLRNIQIKSKNPLRGLFEGMMIINVSQIIKITSEKIIVDNNLKFDKVFKDIKIKLPNKKTQLATTFIQNK